jgi:UDP-N-acetylmuramoyl-tripeptide--D-alanyl-D-alanine ligase
LHGDYNLPNILAAASIGLDLDVSLEGIRMGIEKYYPSNLRSQILTIGSSTIIMDCYNANPSSMELALKNAADHTIQRKIAILGSMKELGSYSLDEHRKIANLAAKLKFDEIILFGEEFAEISLKTGIITDCFEELTNYLRSMDLSHSLILIKGSRANRLERLEEIIKYHHSLNN